MASMEEALRQNYRNNSGFASAYPQPQRTPWKDFGNNVLDAVKYDPDPNTTWLERSGSNLMGDMNSMITGFDAQGNKIPDTLRMISLLAPGGTGLGGKAGLGILGAATGASPKVGSAYASRLMPALENMPQEKMSADQFSGWFGKQPVGADELEYSGIPGLLAQGGDVTKIGLLDQARANPIEITDVIKGGGGADNAKIEELTDMMQQAERAEDWISVEQFQDELYALKDANGATTKFSEYQLPGGENYKEMLLTLPEGRSTITNTELARLDELTDKRIANSLDGLTDAERNEYLSLVGKREGKGQFRSGHFDEPNVLSHARYNTRTIDGDKTTFLEEIQSDWHQKGRDVGYASESDTATKALQVESDAIINRATRDPATGGMTIRPEDLPRYNELQPLIQEGLPMKPNTVPDAPYKRTDKWAGLTLQRMVKEAVDSGHDRIAWTPGKVQAERYDLSKRVGEIQYEPDSKKLQVYGKNEFSPFISEIVEPENLADFIGKEASERLLASRQAKFTQGGPDGIVEKKHHLIKGKDLEIGGEGMKEFYDKMLVKSANKFGKKYGAKVEVKGLNLGVKVAPRQDGGFTIERDGVGTGHYATAEEAQRQIDSKGFGDQEVWSMKITPEMKAGISKGVMLGKTGGESKIGAGLLLQDDSEMTQTLQNNPYRIGDTTGINSSMMQALQGNGRNY